MNIVEGLARQIRRVTELREHYRSIGRELGQSVNVQAAMLLMDAALERACKVIGTGDVVAIAAAGQDLEGFSE